jgi:ABC-type polysaccharide/polyol phosphate transport system ATPase subunit
VLSGITFSVKQGQTLSIIGRNGSGKSTLLKVLAGIYRVDHGRVRVHGRIGALLDLGTGFHPEFSGRENVFIRHYSPHSPYKKSKSLISEGPEL